MEKRLLPSRELHYQQFMREHYPQFGAMLFIEEPRRTRNQYLVLDHNFRVVYQTDRVYHKGDYRSPVANWAKKLPGGEAYKESGGTLLDVVTHVHVKWALNYAAQYHMVPNGDDYRRLELHEYEVEPSSDAFNQFEQDCRSYRNDVAVRLEEAGLEREQPSTGTDIRIYTF